MIILAKSLLFDATLHLAKIAKNRNATHKSVKILRDNVKKI